jgi:hypothetical protein
MRYNCQPTGNQIPDARAVERPDDSLDATRFHVGCSTGSPRTKTRMTFFGSVAIAAAVVDAGLAAEGMVYRPFRRILCGDYKN